MSGLNLVNVSYSRGQLLIVDRQSFELPRGQTLLVTGPNGAGKSTLLYLCAGLVRADVGTVTIGGAPVDPEHPSELMRQGVRRGFVFQQDGLIANLSALANVGLALRYHADLLGLGEKEIDQRARDCLRRMGVFSPDIHAQPGRLSFGIRRRVAFARALALQPNFAFFDDPDAGLDGQNTMFVHQTLLRYRDDPEVTMVVATNHRTLIERLELPAHELLAGRLIEVGRGHDLPVLV